MIIKELINFIIRLLRIITRKIIIIENNYQINNYKLLFYFNYKNNY